VEVSGAGGCRGPLGESVVVGGLGFTGGPRVVREGPWADRVMCWLGVSVGVGVRGLRAVEGRCGKIGRGDCGFTGAQVNGPLRTGGPCSGLQEEFMCGVRGPRGDNAFREPPVVHGRVLAGWSGGPRSGCGRRVGGRPRWVGRLEPVREAGTVPGRRESQMRGAGDLWECLRRRDPGGVLAGVAVCGTG